MRVMGGGSFVHITRRRLMAFQKCVHNRQREGALHHQSWVRALFMSSNLTTTNQIKTGEVSEGEREGKNCCSSDNKSRVKVEFSFCCKSRQHCGLGVNACSSSVLLCYGILFLSHLHPALSALYALSIISFATLPYFPPPHYSCSVPNSQAAIHRNEYCNFYFLQLRKSCAYFNSNRIP